MRTRYKILEENQPHLITSTTVEWLPVFTKSRYCDVLIENLKYCQANKGLKIHAFVILDNHFHLLISGDKLTKTIKEFKSYTAKKMLEILKKDNVSWLLNQFDFYKKKHKNDSNYQFWQEGYHPQLIFDYNVLLQKIEYIHNNPRRRGLVNKIEDWVYSSASNYLNGDGVLEVEVIE